MFEGITLSKPGIFLQCKNIPKPLTSTLLLDLFSHSSNSTIYTWQHMVFIMCMCNIGKLVANVTDSWYEYRCISTGCCIYIHKYFMLSIINYWKHNWIEFVFLVKLARNIKFRYKCIKILHTRQDNKNSTSSNWIQYVMVSTTWPKNESQL